MPAKPRNNRVELRLTELEKKDWSEAAGGTRKLSEWIRATCNAEANRLRRAELPEGFNPLQYEEYQRSLGIPVAKPVIVEDAIQREIQGEGVRPSAGYRERRPRAQGSEGDFTAPGLQDQAHRESRSLPVTQEPGDDSKGTLRTSVLASDDGSGCPRWQHHRPGVYCGACKRVIAK